ncbi:hypothetical protein Tco_1119393 [Tanacetum coccineum]
MSRLSLKNVFYHLACIAILSSDFLLACLLYFELIIVTIKLVPVSQAENPLLSLELDDEGKPLEKVVSSGDHDSKDEVEPLDNEMASLQASKKVGYFTNSLPEQWK